jgi:hypothetical protein
MVWFGSNLPCCAFKTKPTQPLAWPLQLKVQTLKRGHFSVANLGAMRLGF